MTAFNPSGIRGDLELYRDRRSESGTAKLELLL